MRTWPLATLPLLLAATATATAAPTPTPQHLTSQLTLVAAPYDPPVVIAPLTAGATAVERFTAHPRAALPANQPLVAILRAATVELGDSVNVTRAERIGTKIYLDVEERICMCGHTVSGPVVPYVEVALGALPAGDYVLVLRETALTYTDELHPETARNPQRLLELGGMQITIR